MSNALQINGAQSEKPTKFAPMYVGRMFSGIWTNRSPLRDAATTRTEEKFYGPRGDAMIAGQNIEVTNRLTLARRPGNQIYDNVNSYTNVLAFDEFRYNKALSDAFGTTLETIDTMVDTATALHANNAGVDQTVWTKSSGAGQSFMQTVGKQLYFGNGVDGKKWNQSLFQRNSGNNTTAVNTDTYPFMDTYLIDPNNNIQQMIGVKISSVSNVVVASDVLTLTVTNLGANQPIGTQFILWGFTNTNTVWLNGYTITLTAAYTSGGTTLTASVLHADMSQADAGIIQVANGGSPVTGGSVPTWGTVVPSASNFFMGSITVDGNVIWVNRGAPTQNWGLAAPKTAPTYSATGSATGWAASTYYSPASVYVDNNAGYLWQISTPGITGTVQPSWPGSPTATQKVDVTAIAIAANVVTVTTSTQSPAFIAGQSVTLNYLDVATFLNGVTLTVLSSGLTTTQFKANYTYSAGTYTSAVDEGVALTGGTTQADGAAVWTCIQTPASLTWSAHTHRFEGDYIIAKPAGGVNSLFQLSKNTQPHINGPITEQGWNSTSTGAFNKYFPQTTSDVTLTPPSLHWKTVGAANTLWFHINGAGETGSTVDSGFYAPFEAATYCDIYIPAAGTYTFSLQHDDGAFFAFDSSTGAYKVLGGFTEASGFIGSPHTQTAWKGYGGTAGVNLAGNNNAGSRTDSATWSFPAAGIYGLEIDWSNWKDSSTMILQCNGQEIAITPDETGAIQPVWPVFTTTGASYSTTKQQIIFGARVQEAANQYTWSNLGPQTDFAWTATIDYTLPGTSIVDTANNEEAAYETGYTGKTSPAWSGSINTITPDPNPNLKWINEGPVPIQPTVTGKITATSTQGWIYALALVNTLDNTVSNIGPLSASTGPIVSGHVTFAPGSGLDISTIDPQADYVAIFRTTDGFSTELLIPSFNGNTIYTVPLTQYLRYGYVDITPDTGLDTQAQAATVENTPPLPGAINLTYHLNRIWYSIGNTVFWTSGPNDPIGNGINGFGPNNYDVMSSLVKRLVPTPLGVLVFTVSDIVVIPNTSNGIIQPSLTYVPGVGISSYNALDVNGPTIGFFTTDSQFLTFSPSGGLSIESLPIADQLILKNGTAGQNWDTKNVFVAWYASGQDMGWFVADGSQGWYRLINNPSPDLGKSWSPFAAIQGGVKAIKSVETSPGVHNLLLGPTGTGKILVRTPTATTDGGVNGSNGTPYPAYAVLGSYVLAQPGQVAQVGFITTDSVNVGSPLIIGLLIDEALPYYTGSFDMLKNWTHDPPTLKPSKSIIGQRFYLSDTQEEAACRHMQVMVQWPPEAAPNELQSFTIFGSFVQEN